jgi:hypothetical protein
MEFMWGFDRDGAASVQEAISNAFGSIFPYEFDLGAC